MRQERRKTPLLLAATVLLLPACGRAPVPIDHDQEGTSPSYSGSNTETTGSETTPSDPHRMPPNPHAGMGQQGGEEVRWTGVVRLRGELADREQGFVFVSIKPEGISQPCFTRKYALTDPAVSPKSDGERVIEFVIDQTNSLGGLVPGPLVLEAMFDPDGYVDIDPELNIYGSVPAKVNEEGLEVIVDPS